MYIGGSDSASPDLVVSNVGGTEIARVTVAGNFNIPGTGTGANWVATSDERLKYNITSATVNDRLADLVVICDYLWKNSDTPGRSPIAQRIKEIAPQYVHEGEDGFLAIDKAGLALECVVGLAARTRDLEAFTRDLEGRLKALEGNK